MDGLVIKSTGSWYKVRTKNGAYYDCKIRGKIKITQGLKATNPVAVGDWVIFNWDEQNQTGIIEEIKNRKNYLIRKATKLSKQVHVLAANIDQAVLVSSMVQPEVPLRFIDRFLVTAEAYNVPVIIVFNKQDLIQNDAQKAKQKDALNLYEKLGYPSLICSAKENSGILELKKLLHGKVNFLAGFSGVGKSSIINAIAPKLNLKTSSISDFSQKGKHTTTFAEMFELSENTFLVDSPGIKSLGVLGIEPYELSHFFPEMKRVLNDCKFHNCLHLKEPKCAVKAAIENGEIDERRYISYLHILEGNNNYR